MEIAPGYACRAMVRVAISPIGGHPSTCTRAHRNIITTAVAARPTGRLRGLILPVVALSWSDGQELVLDGRN